MKTIIIKQKEKEIMRIKKTTYGVELLVLDKIGEVEVKCVMENNEIIKLNNKK